MITIAEIQDLARAYGYTFTKEQAIELRRVNAYMASIGYYDFIGHFFAVLGKWSTDEIIARTGGSEKVAV